MREKNRVRREFAEHTMLDFDSINEYQLEKEHARKIMEYTSDRWTIEADELRYR